MAEIVGEYLKKGAQVYIEGRLQTKKYQDKEGHEKYITEVIASEMKMLGKKEFQPTSDGEANYSVDTATNAPKGAFDNFEDDIPF